MEKPDPPLLTIATRRAYGWAAGLVLLTCAVCAWISLQGSDARSAPSSGTSARIMPIHLVLA
ncbi:hypothetical protein C7451_101508 [Blastomonas natatoria]|uniref:Uncharacterized protein n=1 Tax=Blastomonas natatoria TaxID=34015 RepID=A0A2V3VCW6_9SPHN|nr:hypothetical protein [Blastomonas natatoria]PXW79440.1 hypothetical protein C7451_101508 [Blastomonas natatoria]